MPTERPDSLAAERKRMYRSLRAEYLEVWTRAVTHLLGWTDSQVLSWADRTYSRFYESNDIKILESFFHGQPELYVAFLLIRELFVHDSPGVERAQLLGAERAQLARRLAFAGIRGERRTKKTMDYDEEDWTIARERVRAVLSEYGIALPERGK